MKDTKIRLQTFQDKDTILLFETIIRGGIGIVLVDRYVESDGNKKISFIEANNLYASVMIQSLPFNKTKLKKLLK